MTVKKLPLEESISAVLAQHYMADTAGDVLLLSASSLAKRDRHVQRASFQSSQAGNLFFTLSPEEDATNPNPDVQAEVLWDAAVALTANKITSPGVTFTALKFTFTAPGELHIALE